ncbi:unnamed protein product [Lupinus luteus]|uniref:Uncharacterized protein n=1 Tax=Lupinus luteus TaxID=3873 RepID=A0AAV1WA59_LUPLU
MQEFQPPMAPSFKRHQVGSYGKESDPKFIYRFLPVWFRVFNIKISSVIHFRNVKFS